MLIWIITILLLATFAALGHAKGAIRMIVSVIGLIFATTLALPLGNLAKPLFPMMGVKNPLWLWLLPPVVVFVLLSLIFVAAAFVVHQQIALWYKYKSDDLHRLKWERMNKRLGIGVGLVAGAVYSVVLGVIVYVAGYFTVQVASDSAPATLRFLNQARTELSDSGLESLLAEFDPAPALYYEAADILGLIYNNPVLESRIAAYPPFLILAERTEFQEIAADAQVNELVKSQANILDILNHPKVQAVLANQEIIQQLLQLDLKDLRQFLETGKSAKFEEEKILGRWRVDGFATLVLQKKNKPDITAKEMGRLKQLATTLFPGITLVATADNKAIVKVELTDQAKKLIDSILNPQPVVIPRPVDAEPPPPAIDPRFAARYGLNRPGGRPGIPTPEVPPTPAPVPLAKPPPPHPLADLTLSAQGTWQRAGDKYQLKLQNEKGKEETAEALVEGDKLTIMKSGQTIIFIRS
ncbi:MAG: CvpA family protein [Verrucomicrobia bacterium]|nr:CvpA family protein [Verrucomicrobiota bacterium]